jgi:hypothetical protein
LLRKAKRAANTGTELDLSSYKALRAAITGAELALLRKAKRDEHRQRARRAGSIRVARSRLRQMGASDRSDEQFNLCSRYTCFGWSAGYAGTYVRSDLEVKDHRCPAGT